MKTKWLFFILLLSGSVLRSFGQIENFLVISNTNYVMNVKKVGDANADLHTIQRDDVVKFTTFKLDKPDHRFVQGTTYNVFTISQESSKTVSYLFLSNDAAAWFPALREAGEFKVHGLTKKLTIKHYDAYTLSVQQNVENGPLDFTWDVYREENGRYIPVATFSAETKPMKWPIPRDKEAVTIYENTNYGGKSSSFGTGNKSKFSLQNSSVGNDAASSVKVKSGYELTLYEHDASRGRKVVLTENVPNLALKENFDNIASNIEVRKIQIPHSPPLPLTIENNLAYKKSTRASSEALGGIASRATDGNTNSLWAQNSITHTKDEKDPWLEVDLGKVYDITNISIYNRTDECCWSRLNGYYIMVSEQPIVTNSTDPKYLFNGGPHTINGPNVMSQQFKDNKKGRYVRVFIPGNDKVLSLAEIGVWSR